MPVKKQKKRTTRRRRRTSYPKGYTRVSDQKLKAERKRHPNKFPASLLKRKVENAAKRAKKMPGQLGLFG